MAGGDPVMTRSLHRFLLQSLMVLFGTACCGAPAPAQPPAAAPTTQPSDWQPPADRPTLRLWPEGAPGPQTATEAEHDATKPTDPLIMGRVLIHLADVSDPTITFYAAPAAKNSGAAVVVFPGGGY